MSKSDCAEFDRILEEKRALEKAAEEAGNRGKAAEDRDVQGKGTGKEKYISRWNVKW